MVTPNTFFITLSINFYTIFFLIKNQTSDSQEKANLCFSSIFPKGEEVYNGQKHQLSSYCPYLQLLFMQKTDRSVAASFQTKDSILRQLHFIIMYKYILISVMIIE